MGSPGQTVENAVRFPGLPTGQRLPTSSTAQQDRAELLEHVHPVLLGASQNP
jgi:hypothetical protein